MDEKSNIKSDLIKVNHTKAQYVSSIAKEIRAANSDNVKKLQSADVSNEYWNLLKSSKSKVKDTKDGVDTMVSLNNKWNKILILKNEGQTLSEDQKEFMTDYISDEFKEYFTTNVGLKNENYQWQKFNKKLVELYSKHLKKKEKSVAQSGNNVSATDENKDYRIGILVCALGIICIIAGIILLVKHENVTLYPGIIAVIVGVGILVWGIYKVHNSKYKEIPSDNGGTTSYEPDIGKSYQSLDDAEEVKDNVPLLSEIEASPPPSLKTLETFFVKLENEIKAEKSENQFFQSLQKEVVQIINSLKTLQDECEALVQQIGTAQNYARK